MYLIFHKYNLNHYNFLFSNPKYKQFYLYVIRINKIYYLLYDVDQQEYLHKSHLLDHTNLFLLLKVPIKSEHQLRHVFN